MGCHRYSLMECDGLDDDSDDICDCFPNGRLAISSVAAEGKRDEEKWRRLRCPCPFYTFGCP